MTLENKIALAENRLKTLKASPKNVKCPSVVRALERELINMKVQLA